MNSLDYAVLFATLLGIAAYGIWRTHGRRDLSLYLKGRSDTPWFTIGLSVMATQASAITFLSTPGQGYEDGLGFVQNYFGAPFALIVVCAVFLPLYRKFNVYTAYEFLGKRFDSKTRLLGTAIFLVQRGLGAGITIYAPAIVLSTVMGWRLDLTIVAAGLVVVAYTVTGGNEAVNLTQRFQIGVIFLGMAAAAVVILMRMPVGMDGAMTIAGGFHKLQGVDFSVNLDKRYTFWSGILGGMFLALAYFGTDQSQVQRYLTGSSLRESRLGLMFNAVAKIPMQFFILMLGVMMFVFYQFEAPPVFFNQTEWKRLEKSDPQGPWAGLEEDFAAAKAKEKVFIGAWLDARKAGDPGRVAVLRYEAGKSLADAEAIRAKAREALKAADPKAASNDADYVFITFILGHLPHGLIGLLVTAFFAAALSAKAAELNALGETTTVDLYRHIVRREASDAHYVAASKWFTALWGLVAIGFALLAHLSENLIQATNILGSVFYGVVLGLFLVAFFLRKVRGTAVFWGALAAQALVFVLYLSLSISYLWYNLIGCAACMGFSLILELFLGRGQVSTLNMSVES